MSQWTHQSARAAALKVLRQYNTHRGDAAELLHSELDMTHRTGQATDLVYGVIRNTPLLDWLLTQVAAIQPRHVKPAIRGILRMGVYELVFAPKTADYAIVNEAVNLARRFGSRKIAGFVNGVLRQIQRHIASRDVSLEHPRFDVRAIIPRTDGGGCALSSPLLPDPSPAPDDYLHLVWSLPRWLVRDWIAAYGAETAAQICLACNRHPSVVAWPNTQRIDSGTLAERLAAEGVTCRLLPVNGAVQLRRGRGPLTAVQAFREGLFYVQDPTAEAVSTFLAPQPGDCLVDLCAAPGGKAIACALKMNDTGCIIASDASTTRLARLDENTARLGLSCIRRVSQNELDQAVRSLDRLDAIILDVPCSNTGVLARRVEARHRLERGLPAPLLRRQRELLEYAYARLRPGAKLLYSTCSIHPKENTHQIQTFLQVHPDLYLIKEQIVFPSIENADAVDHDGGYMALLGTLSIDDSGVFS
ncbi:MAG TPA: hypothetical protein ENN97_05525 [Phycisphaerales bacterium]|nr:hypothetical protein [Phycisphaerales bacterium]